MHQHGATQASLRGRASTGRRKRPYPASSPLPPLRGRASKHLVGGGTVSSALLPPQGINAIIHHKIKEREVNSFE